MLFDLDKSVYVNMFGKHNQIGGFWHDKHAISANLILYIINGSLNMEIDDVVYHADAGDVLFIPANTSYRPLECEESLYYFLHFTASSAENTPTNMQNIIKRFRDDGPQIGYIYNYYGPKEYNSIVEIPYHSKHGTTGKINEIFNRAAKLNIWRNNAEKLLLDNIARELLISISPAISNEQSTNPTLQKILHYIQAHFTEPINLTKISQTFEISNSYITKLFRTYLGIGTVDYINDLRLSFACEQLISSNYSISEISNMVGFSNQYYFDRIFKRKYGLTPKEFRKANYIMRP